MPGPPPLPFDPFAAAREAMEREDKQRRIENARALIDDEYRKRRENEEEQQRKREEREARQPLAYAGQTMAQLGIPGAAAVSGYAAGGLPGAGAAAAMSLIQTLKEALHDVLSAGGKAVQGVMSFDPIAINRSFADLATKIPIVGGVFGGLINMTLDLSDAMLATAKRLSAYDANLAMGLARLEIDRIMRDIERARTHGPDILAAVERRASFEEKWSAFIDRMMPTVLKFLDDMMAMLEENAEPIAQAIQLILQVMLLIAQAIGGIASVLRAATGDFLGRLDAIEDRLRPRDDSPPFLRAFMDMVAPPGTVLARTGGSTSPGVPLFGGS